jgi:hypothetical protein
MLVRLRRRYGIYIYKYLPDTDIVANLELVIIADGMRDIFDILFVFTAVDREAWEFFALH